MIVTRNGKTYDLLKLIDSDLNEEPDYNKYSLSKTNKLLEYYYGMKLRNFVKSKDCKGYTPYLLVYVDSNELFIQEEVTLYSIAKTLLDDKGLYY